MAEWLNAPVLKTGNCNRFWGSNPCLSAKLYYMLLTYYIICIIYCFYQLNKKYKTKGIGFGTSPEMDAIMVLIMAWVLAPVDVSLTWIRMVKEAEAIQNAKKRYTDRWI